MKAFLPFLAALLILPGLVLAEEYYVTQDGEGSRNGTPGNSWSVSQFNNGGGGGNTYGPGDTVYIGWRDFNHKGSDIHSQIFVYRGGSPGNELILDGYPAGEYDPINHPDAGDPGKDSHTVIKADSDGDLLIRGDSLNGIDRGYITVQDFEIDGQRTAQDPIQIYDGAHHIRFRNCYIHDARWRGLWASKGQISANPVRYGERPHHITIGGAPGDGCAFEDIGWFWPHDGGTDCHPADTDLEISYSDYAVVSYNRFFHSGTGDYGSTPPQFETSNYLLFEHNEVFGHAAEGGPANKNTDNWISRFNHIHGITGGSGTGLYFDYTPIAGENIYIYGNSIHSISENPNNPEGGQGIVMMAGAKNVHIWSNIIYDNDGAGIAISSHIDNCKDIFIYNNVLADNADCSSDNCVWDKGGIYISSSQSTGEIKNNIFIDNYGNPVEGNTGGFTVSGNELYASAGDFLDYNGRDFRLSEGASEIDSGADLSGIAGSVTIYDPADWSPKTYTMRYDEAINPLGNDFSTFPPSVTMSDQNSNPPWEKGAYVYTGDSQCGNGNCDSGECNSCPQDCGFQDCCPDGYCNNGETCSTCPQDCGSCPVTESHWLEAEYPDTLTSPMQEDSDTGASEGGFISVPNGNGNVMDPSQPGGLATYDVTVANPGDYALWGRIRGPTGEDDSFFADISGTGFRLWDLETGTTQWTWDLVNERDVSDPVIFTLTSGSHTITIKQREDGSEIDKLLLTSDLSYTPSGTGEPAGNIPQDTCTSLGYFCCYPSSCQSPQPVYDSDCPGTQVCCGSCASSGFDPCWGIELLYHFDNREDFGESASLVRDFSGNNRNAAVHGAVHESASGMFGGAFIFDGDNDYMDSGDVCEPVDEITFSAWVLPEGDGTETVILSKYSALPAEYEMMIGTPGGYIARSDEGASYKGNIFAIDPEHHTSYSGWVHVAGSYGDDDRMRLYVNGQLKDEGDAFSRDISRDDSLTIGKRAFPGSEGHFSGLIDEIAIWSRSLSHEEIQELRDRGAIYCIPGDFHKSDTSPGFGCVSMDELVSFISLWHMDSTANPMPELMEAVGYYRNPGYWC